jgi:hypothetical protein
MEYNGRFFDAVFAQRPGEWSDRWALQDELQEGLALWNALKRIQEKLKYRSPGKEDQGKHDALLRFGQEVIDTVHALSVPEPDTYIRYADLNLTGKKGAVEALSVQYEPLEVADELQRMLFAAWPRVISTSATLSIEGSLGWYERRV